MPGIGEVDITGVNINPVEVTPGGVVEVTVILTETAEFVGPFGQLRLCNPDGLNTTGLEVESVVQPSWRSELSRVVCIGVSNIGSGEAELTYTLTAPQDVGQYDIDALIRSTKNPSESSPIRNTVTVSTGEGAVDNPRDDDERGNGGIDLPGPPNGNGGSGLFAFAVENPGVTLVLAGGAAIAINSFSGSLAE
jgi:hypothetical protein